ncbi:MAG TPA: iron-sulfur cluster assembly scaffold protein [bacterium]|nr:iron-sulfur cluster assembly scaffold protein [bacterium]
MLQLYPMNQLYRELILDHYKNPRNTKSLSEHTHEGTEENLSCGDSIRVQIRMTNDKIQEIGHHTEGCAISIASSSILSEELLGKTPDEIRNFDENDIMNMLGTKLTTSRISCAMLPVEALKKALQVDE